MHLSVLINPILILLSYIIMNLIAEKAFYSSLFWQYSSVYNDINGLRSDLALANQLAHWTQWPQWWSRTTGWEQLTHTHTHTYCTLPVCSHSCVLQWSLVTTIFLSDPMSQHSICVQRSIFSLYLWSQPDTHLIVLCIFHSSPHSSDVQLHAVTLCCLFVYVR